MHLPSSGRRSATGRRQGARVLHTRSRPCAVRGVARLCTRTRTSATHRARTHPRAPSCARDCSRGYSGTRGAHDASGHAQHGAARNRARPQAVVGTHAGMHDAGTGSPQGAAEHQATERERRCRAIAARARRVTSGPLPWHLEFAAQPNVLWVVRALTTEPHHAAQAAQNRRPAPRALHGRWVLGAECPWPGESVVESSLPGASHRPARMAPHNCAREGISRNGGQLEEAPHT